MSIYATNAWRKLQAQFRQHCRARNLNCWLCDQPIDWKAPARSPNAFEADHYWPLATHPDLAYSFENLRCSHKRCNASRGKATPERGHWVAADW